MFSLSRYDTSVIKGIAICAMLFHHLYTCPEDIGEGVEPYTGIYEWIGILGKVCVAMFLFCSAYGLSSQYKSISIVDDLKFIIKRLIKFFVNYWIIFLIFVPITYFVFDRSFTEAYGENVNIPKRFIFDILGVQGFSSYNITWWFNQLIIILYLLFPVIFRAVRAKPWLAILVGIVLVQISQNIQYNPADILLWQLPFVLGIIWKLCEDKLQSASEWLIRHKIIFASGSLLLMVLIVIVRMWPIIPSWTGIRIDAFLTCSIVLMVVSIGRYLPYVSGAFAFLGKHSMNIYMTHTFFNAYWSPDWLHSGEWMRGGGNFVVLMTICVIISIGIEFLKEKIRLYELVNIITKRI